MNATNLELPPDHQRVVDRFVKACLEDDRIVAAFLGGSYASGLIDTYSDLDLFFVTTDNEYEEFLDERRDFVRRLGEPLFLEDFGAEHGCCFILADGVEGDIWFGRESRFQQIHGGPYTVLVDKNGCLTDIEFPRRQADKSVQIDGLRNQLSWFWHELSHFVKAMGRGQLWFGYGQLEMMRQICVSLARLKYDFTDIYATKEPYFKIEQALPTEMLAPLEDTFCPMEYKSMYQAALAICQYYRDVAPALAEEYQLTYQTSLDEHMMGQLRELDAVGGITDFTIDASPARADSIARAEDACVSNQQRVDEFKGLSSCT